MSNAYTLAEVENEIASVYQWFHTEAGIRVIPKEEGQLGSLWALHDLLVEDRRVELTPEAFRVEHGRGNQTAL